MTTILSVLLVIAIAFLCLATFVVVAYAAYGFFISVWDEAGLFMAVILTGAIISIGVILVICMIAKGA